MHRYLRNYHALCEESTKFTGSVEFNMIMNLRYGGITKFDADGLKFRISYILLLISYTIKNCEIAGSHIAKMTCVIRKLTKNCL
jgi:hypothetical protein